MAFDPLVLPASSPDRHVAKGAAACPIALAGLAEVPGLGEAVVVVITKLGVGRVAPRAPQGLLLLLLFLVRLFHELSGGGGGAGGNSDGDRHGQIR